MCEFEMPTPCRNCLKIFDLNTGGGSDLWFPDSQICRECYDKEQEEITRLQEIGDALSNLEHYEDLLEEANQGIRNAKQELQRLKYDETKDEIPEDFY